MSYRKIILILCLGIFLSSERGANAQTSVTYNYVSNATQTWTVPACVTQITVQMWGAGGGSGNMYGPYDNDGYKAGASGAYYQAKISGISTGQVLTLYVPSGGQVADGDAEVYDWGSVSAGGWPGGGSGGWGGYDYSYGGGGGGYAGIAINGNYYLVAGGGGGGGGYCCEQNQYGGGGGAPNGQSGGSYCCYAAAGGGTCSSGGAAAASVFGYYATAGSYLQGGHGAGTVYSGEFGGGGGGGGYYGGGGGDDYLYSSGGGGGGGFPCSSPYTFNGITTTVITGTVGNTGNSPSNYAAPGGAPATIGYGGYNANGGNGEIIITYIAMQATGVVIGNDSCRNQSNGIATVSILGGTTPYTYSWSPVGGTRDTATGLGEGTYTVTVTSPCGATATASVSISQPNILGASTTILAEVQCHNGSNGKIQANALGGSSPFTYSWSTTPTQTTQTATGLTAGSYTVSITDHCGQTNTATATLTQPAVFSAFRDTVYANVLCKGSATGSAAVYTMTGGGTPFTYSWTPGGLSTSTATGLTAGTYTVSVNDGCGVTLTSTVTITQPATALTVSASDVTEETCNGNSVGQVTSAPAGGTGAYTYLWSPSSKTTQTASSLSAGTYTITVHDNNGCTATATATITQPAVLSATATVQSNDRCHGGSNGAVTVSATSGGTSPYTYVWNPGNSNAQTVANLSAGTYTVTVTDNHGCSLTLSATVTQPAALSVSATTTANVLCNGGNNATTNAVPSNGTGPYTYSWTSSPVQTTQSASGLTAGVYTVTVTDNCGASVSAATVVTQPTVLVGPAYTTFNVLCNGGSDGMVDDSAKGGTAPYTYAWSDANSSTTMGVNNLSAGTYSVTVTDADGCSLTAHTTITQATALAVSTLATGYVQCNGQNNGSAASRVTGGTVPYTYSWTGGAGSTDTAVGLTAGTYTLNVTDNHGCMGSSSVLITQPTVLVASASTPLNVICNGYSTGTVTSVAAGGTGPYTYVWSVIGVVSDTATGLSIGTYTVTVSDSHGCTTTAETTITQPIALIVGAGTVLNNLCYDVNVGKIVAYVGGGPAPYTYMWSNSQTSDTATGLGIGTYSVTVTDKDGCTGTAQAVITQPAKLVVTFDSVADNGDCTGAAWAYPTGGVAPYQYLWTNGSTTFNITNQCHGYYCCLVTDANGCQADTCFHISTYLGVDNITASGNGGITVYPNPNTGEFTIESNGITGQAQVEIYNVLGEKISSGVIDANKGGRTTINISTQPNGIYLYRVISNENGNLVGEGKIVLEK